MTHRIHIFGASGSGTTTLANALAEKLNINHFDTDNYFWIPSNPPFQHICEISKRQFLLRNELEQNKSWVISGSLCGWGDFTMPMFDLAVFLWIPSELRLKRLRQREIKRNGQNIDSPEHPRHEAYKIFMEWAAKYDTGSTDMRSRACHEEWILKLPCPFIRIQENKTVTEKVGLVLENLKCEYHHAQETGR